MKSDRCFPYEFELYSSSSQHISGCLRRASCRLKPPLNSLALEMSKVQPKWLLLLEELVCCFWVHQYFKAFLKASHAFLHHAMSSANPIIYAPDDSGRQALPQRLYSKISVLLRRYLLIVLKYVPSLRNLPLACKYVRCRLFFFRNPDKCGESPVLLSENISGSIRCVPVVSILILFAFEPLEVSKLF